MQTSTRLDKVLIMEITLLEFHKLHRASSNEDLR